MRLQKGRRLTRGLKSPDGTYTDEIIMELSPPVVSLIKVRRVGFEPYLQWRRLPQLHFFSVVVKHCCFREI